MKITIYLSKQGYDKKPDKAAGIIKTISSYDLVDIEIEELYRQLSNGHFIHAECGYSSSNNGSNCYTFKKQFLKQTQIMQIDFDYKFKDTKPTGEIVEKEYKDDEMPQWNEKLLSNLKYINSQGKEIDISPTFWMESFSAHKVTEKKIVGNSVHLFYVFNDPIYNIYDFEKTSISIIYSVYNALKYNGYNIPLEKERCPFDPVSTDMFQGIWGSYGKGHGYTGKTYFWDEFKNAYKKEFKDFIFQVKTNEMNEATQDDIKRTIEAYSTVKTIDDIDIDKCQFIKYKKYFGHEEGFHIMSVLKHEYSLIEDNVNNRQSLCYQVCKKLLLGHCNDFFDGNEDNFYHEYKRCKIYNKKGTSDAAYLSHVIKLIGDTGALPIIEYKEKDEKYDKTIQLTKNEYLSDKKDEILSLMNKDTINFLIADPGLGKTVFAKSLSGNTLIIELFNSIIQSEEKFSSDDFTKFYGDKYISEKNITRMNVCSANKFISWYKGDKDKNNNFYRNIYDFDDKCLFDNIILDESHLLCLSNYRYDIMGETVQYIKKLKSDYPQTNIILMTGTPFGEELIFNELNTIKIESEPRYSKIFHMIQTSSVEGYIKELIKKTLGQGLRVFIPVDSENWFDTFIESCIDEGIITKDKTYYFNQPKNEEEIEKTILNTKLIGDIKILGTSSYMSVGIDLEDWKTEFVTIIPTGSSVTGNFSGHEVSQFANRHRKQNLEVYYVITMNEANKVKPYLTKSCRALLNIKSDLLKTMYRRDPIVIKMPKYLSKSNDDSLEVNEDMFNIFVYYKDMKPIISHPMVIYEYMESNGWKCDWNVVENTHRGINTKEHREEEKKIGVSEFMKLMNIWNECNYPIIKVKESIQDEFEIIKHESEYSLFEVDSIEVGFTNYYAKNLLFNELLHLREYFTGRGTYNIIMDSFENDKINISFIDKTLLAIKLIINCNKSYLWDEISQKLGKFYNQYSKVENGVYKDNKKEFENQRDKIIQEIWDSLSQNIEDETLKRIFQTNYNNITDNLITDFMDGIKLVQTMYLEKQSIVKKINGKSERITVYSWNENKLERYEIRDDKKGKK